MLRYIFTILSATQLLFSLRCAIDTPVYNSTSRLSCRTSFDLDLPYYFYFDYSGTLNGLAISGTAAVTPAAPITAGTTRQMIVATESFSLTINLTSSAYGTKTLAIGNPEVWMSAVTCATYYTCSTEKYVAGFYNATLRGSGTVNLSRLTNNATKIILNATLPDENTSVSQALQFQNVIFTEACY